MGFNDVVIETPLHNMCAALEQEERPGYQSMQIGLISSNQIVSEPTFAIQPSLQIADEMALQLGQKTAE